MALRCWRGTTIITRTRKKRSTNMRMSTSMKRGAAMIPTVWLSPLNAKREMENIKNAMAEADPANAEYYEANYAAWSARCDQLDQAFKDGLSNLAIQDIVVSHELGYLCDAYGLNQVGIGGNFA